ncbi:hypothetical protein NUM3379_24580 [Kineococcus sp. NUM-3379]
MTASSPSTPPRPGGLRALAVLSLLAALAAPLAAAFTDPASLSTYLPWSPVLSMLCGAVLLATADGRGDLRVRYAATCGVWGAGHLATSLLHSTGLGGPTAALLALTVSLTGVVVLLQLGVLRRVVTAHTVLTYLLDAGLLGAALAVLCWHVLSTLGATGADPALDAVTATALLATTHVVARGIHTAVRGPDVRLAGMVLAVSGLSELPYLHSVLTGDTRTGWAALGFAVLGCAAVASRVPTTPRALRTSCAVAAAEHRRELAAVVPAPLLVVDLAWLLSDPSSADRTLYALYLVVMVLYAARHLEATRAYGAVTADLRSQALLDRGTGLGNRTALSEALQEGEPGRPRTVLVVEVDGIEHVNDVLGLGVGDTVIATVGERLGTAAAPAGTFRTGGDEFTVLVDGGIDEALALAPALRDAVRSAPSLVPEAHRFDLDATIGAACTAGPGATRDPLAVLTDAGLALRGARAGGTGTVAAFDGAIAEAHRRRLLLRERLQVALAEGSLDVHFQPVIDMSTGGVASFEALARWTDDVLGRVSPAEFVAVAEEANLVVALGQHVLTSAVRTASAAGVFAAGAGVAVNVSVVQLHAPGFADVVRAVLAESGAPAHLLTLEVTESVFLDSGSPAERVLTEIADLGVRIAIDDFGAGHSSFGYLGRLPAHVLKIDRSLTSTLTDDSDGQAIVSCIVELATRLRMMVVVEGIETAEQAMVCRLLGAQRGQGWLFEAAVPADKLAQQLQRTFATGTVAA